MCIYTYIICVYIHVYVYLFLIKVLRTGVGEQLVLRNGASKTRYPCVRERNYSLIFHQLGKSIESGIYVRPRSEKLLELHKQQMIPGIGSSSDFLFLEKTPKT
jgi:hypothetical protein